VIQGVRGGLLTGTEQSTMVWLSWGGGAVSGRRNTGCVGRSGRRGAPGLSDVHGRVIRAGGWPVENGTGGCLR
jgi:hypothetical protein